MSIFEVLRERDYRIWPSEICAGALAPLVADGLYGLAICVSGTSTSPYLVSGCKIDRIAMLSMRDGFYLLNREMKKDNGFAMSFADGIAVLPMVMILLDESYAKKTYPIAYSVMGEKNNVHFSGVGIARNSVNAYYNAYKKTHR